MTEDHQQVPTAPNVPEDNLDVSQQQVPIASPAPKEESSDGTPAAAAKPGYFRLFLDAFTDFSGRYHLFQKAFTILFTLLVFGLVYRHTKHNRDALSYFGIMLMMTVMYIEMLIIRDHLWVLEGSLRQGRQWRDFFFSERTMRMQRLRKVFIVIFAAAIFTYVYWTHWSQKGTEIFSFLGIILMITVLYFEILTIRDDLRLIEGSLKTMGLMIPDSAKTDETPAIATPPEDGSPAPIGPHTPAPDEGSDGSASG